MRMICTSCGYVYDPEQGDPAGGVVPGVAFASLPASWTCPLCYAAREAFDPFDG